MSYITTFSGRHVDPFNPEQDDFDIRDIAHALSFICRGNGHISTFFSVAQHSIYCAEEAKKLGYSREVILGCLLHDAAEAYLSDVPRPLKQLIPEYNETEDNLLNVIMQKFVGRKLTDNEKQKIREIDNKLLCYDLKYLLNEESITELPEMNVSISYEVRSFSAVENEFLSFFRNLLN